MYAGRNLSSFAKTLQQGQLITLDGKIQYREVSEDVDVVVDDASVHHARPELRKGLRRAAWTA